MSTGHTFPDVKLLTTNCTTVQGLHCMAAPFVIFTPAPSHCYFVQSGSTICFVVVVVVVVDASQDADAPEGADTSQGADAPRDAGAF
jgi:uncharacterized membrane protein